MSKKTIFLHIGLEKTGTTSIQNFLFNNAEKLRKKSIFYPTPLGKNQTRLCIYSGRTKFIGNLATEDKELEIKKELPSQLKTYIKNFEKSSCQNLVFSNEHLSSRLKNSHDVKNLKELFEPYEYPVKIIMYVRNQVDLLESLYFEAIKAGGTETLSDWINNFKYFELDLIKMLGKWESVFGKEEIIIRLFDRKVLKNSDVIDDFLSVLSVNKDGDFILNKNQNISLGYKSIEFMRQYNLNTVVKERKTYQLSNFLNTYKNDKQKISLLDEDRKIIFNKYSKSNHMFLKKYLPDVSYDLFIKTSRKLQEQEFSEDTLWDIINHIINQKIIIKDNQKLNEKSYQLKYQQTKINSLLNNHWYLFGQMSKKKKIWTVGKIISKKIKLYWLLQPIAKLIIQVIGK